MSERRDPGAASYAGLAALAVTTPVLTTYLENAPSFPITLQGGVLLVAACYLLPTAFSYVLSRFLSGRRIFLATTAVACGAVGYQFAASAFDPRRLGAIGESALFFAGAAAGGGLAARFGASLARIFGGLGAASLPLVAAFLGLVALRNPFPAPPKTPALVAGRGPVVVLLFDGLPLASLLDERGGWDTAFPAFARLASEGLWIPEAYTNSDLTQRSVPILLSGRWDTKTEGLASAGPGLLEEVSSVYDLEIYGTALDYRRNFGARAVRTIDDSDYLDRDPGLLLGIFLRAYAWRSFPRAWQTPIREDMFWADFKRPSRAATEALVDSLEGGPLAGRFRYAHLFHPHPPFVTTPDGRLAERPPNEIAFYRATTPDEVSAARAYHREEVAYCDRLLARVRAALERRGAWDAATVLVTSDHGLSSAWETRHAGSEFARDAMTDEIARIPFLLKLPHARPDTVASRYQHLDLLPTLREALELPPGPARPGRSILDPAPSFAAPRVVNKFGTVWTRGEGGWVRAG